MWHFSDLFRTVYFYILHNFSWKTLNETNKSYKLSKTQCKLCHILFAKIRRRKSLNSLLAEITMKHNNNNNKCLRIEQHRRLKSICINSCSTDFIFFQLDFTRKPLYPKYVFSEQTCGDNAEAMPLILHSEILLHQPV